MTGFFTRKTSDLPAPEAALPDREEPIEVSGLHFVNGTSYLPPFPEGTDTAVFGLGCFWGAERLFWKLPGVVTTAVGYAGGLTRHANYGDVCSGRTGHAEVVLVAYDPDQITFDELLRAFWEEHDPTQGMRQGNDIGTQYRSAIYWNSEKQHLEAEASRSRYQERLTAAGNGTITTEIAPAGDFFYAEEYHQQYLGKNPNGYCGLTGTGVSCPTGLDTD
jgi:peptide-methionine (S)-S-oxide reductase